MWLMVVVMLLPIELIPMFSVVPLRVAIPIYLAGLVAALACHHLMLAAKRKRVLTGSEGMVGSPAVVLFRGEEGVEVRCHGERWSAEWSGPEAPRPGDRVTVVAVRGLRLLVHPSP